MPIHIQKISVLVVIVGASLTAMDWVTTPDCQNKDIEAFYNKILNALDDTIYFNTIDRSSGLAQIITRVKHKLNYQKALSRNDIAREAQDIFYSIIQCACEEGKRPEIYWKWYLNSLQLTIPSISIPSGVIDYYNADLDCDLAIIKANCNLSNSKEYQQKLCSFLIAQAKLGCFLERHPRAFTKTNSTDEYID